MRRFILLSVILFQFVSILTREKIHVGSLHIMAQSQTGELDDIVVIGHQTNGDDDDLFSAVFNINQIEGDWILYTTLINEKRPVLTMIEGTYQGQPCNHEVVMVGYSNIKSKFYYIDPSNGLYNYIDYYKIKGPSYKVNSLKNN